MSKLVLDSVLRSKLNGLSEAIELCDESGNTVGRFLPEGQFLQLVQEWAKLRYPLEELDRRADEPIERTTAEMLSRLERE